MIKIFRKKSNLRSECIKRYGEDFGRMYDDLNSGIPIGNLAETLNFIEKVKAVKETLLT